MTTSKVVMFADWGAKVGLGHLFRVVPVARCIARGGGDVTVLTPAPQPPPALELAVDVEIVPVADSPRTIHHEIQHLNPQLVLLDSYRHAAVLSCDLKSRSGARIAKFDDHYTATHPVDVVINASPGCDEARYRRATSGDLLIGPEYASLSPEFVERRDGFEVRPEIARIFVALGGLDTERNLQGLVHALDCMLDDGIEIIVIGGDRRRRGRVMGCGLIPQRELAALLASCDLAVLAGGSMLFQAFCIGVPVVAWPQVPSQRHHVAAWKSRSVLSVADGLEEVLKHLASLRAPGERRRLSAAGRSHIDGHGARRIVDALRIGYGFGGP